MVRRSSAGFIEPPEDKAGVVETLSYEGRHVARCHDNQSAAPPQEWQGLLCEFDGDAPFESRRSGSVQKQSGCEAG